MGKTWVPNTTNRQQVIGGRLVNPGDGAFVDSPDPTVATPVQVQGQLNTAGQLELVVGGQRHRAMTPVAAAAFDSLVPVAGILTRVLGGDTSVPAGEYVFAYRGEQGDFAYPKDQSGKLADASLNPALFPAAWAASTLYTLGTYRSPTTPNGFLYKCTTAGGSATAGAEPNWTTTVGGTNTDASGNVWTCEKGPWYVATTGRRQFRSIGSSQIGAAGAMFLPSVNWDMAAGDSLIVSISGAFDFTGQGDERCILSNVASGGTARGFMVRAGASFKDLRFTVYDGTNIVQSGHTKANFGANPLDGTFRTTTFMVDGPSKRLYAFHDGTPYSQGDMYDAANLSPNDMSLAAATGSTQGLWPTVLGGQTTSGGVVLNSTSFEFGAQRIDLISLRGRALPASLAPIAQWFHQRGALPLPAAYLL